MFIVTTITLLLAGLGLSLTSNHLLKLKNKKQELELEELNFKLALVKQKYEARKTRPLQGFRR